MLAAMQSSYKVSTVDDLKLESDWVHGRVESQCGFYGQPDMNLEIPRNRRTWIKEFPSEICVVVSSVTDCSDSMGGHSSTVGSAITGQVVLVCISKMAEHEDHDLESKTASSIPSRFLLCVSALTSPR